jgi:hypothetical protein
MKITVHIETLSNLTFWVRECESRAITGARNPLADFRRTVHNWKSTREKHRNDRASIRWGKNTAAQFPLEGLHALARASLFSLERFKAARTARLH